MLIGLQFKFYLKGMLWASLMNLTFQDSSISPLSLVWLHQFYEHNVSILLVSCIGTDSLMANFQSDGAGSPVYIKWQHTTIDASLNSRFCDNVRSNFPWCFILNFINEDLGLKLLPSNCIYPTPKQLHVLQIILAWRFCRHEWMRKI